MARCETCDRTIIFVLLPSGRLTPVDVDTVPDGNVVITDHGQNLGRVLGKHEPWPGARYMPHWRTCPQSKEWKERRRSDA